jgi:PAS domain-containing protein
MAEVDAKSSLWKVLWDYDPNGLLVLDETLTIRLVNPALCRMLRSEPAGLIGRPATELLGNVSEFRTALRTGQRRLSVERAYPQYELFVRKLIFPIPEEHIVAGIFVDLTTEWKQKQELQKLKQEAIQEVRRVVDKQMHVAQNIAGLLGETTAETKVSLLHLLEMLKKEDA